LRPFVQSLVALETQVQVGVNFPTYKSYLTRVETAYNGIPVADQSLACLNAVGVPGERAMNDYISAYNAWATCIRRIYAGTAPNGCASPGTPGYGSEQIYWGRASGAVQAAVNGLG
jgi:hypothetical protein